MVLHTSGCGPTHTPQASGASGTNHTQYTRTSPGPPTGRELRYVTRSVARASTGPEAEDVSWAAWRATGDEGRTPSSTSQPRVMTKPRKRARSGIVRTHRLEQIRPPVALPGRCSVLLKLPLVNESYCDNTRINVTITRFPTRARAAQEVLRATRRQRGTTPPTTPPTPRDFRQLKPGHRPCALSPPLPRADSVRARPLLVWLFWLCAFECERPRARHLPEVKQGQSPLD